MNWFFKTVLPIALLCGLAYVNFSGRNKTISDGVMYGVQIGEKKAAVYSKIEKMRQDSHVAAVDLFDDIDFDLEAVQLLGRYFDRWHVVSGQTLFKLTFYGDRVVGSDHFVLNERPKFEGGELVWNTDFDSNQIPEFRLGQTKADVVLLFQPIENLLSSFRLFHPKSTGFDGRVLSVSADIWRFIYHLSSRSYYVELKFSDETGELVKIQSRRI